MIALEVGNLGGLVFIIICIMFGPPLLIAIIGFLIRKKHPKASKVLYIIAAIYTIVGLGICKGVI